MTVKKSLKKPKDGRVYFTVSPEQAEQTGLSIGTKFRYIVESDRIVILSAEESGHTVSKKGIKPLFDLRSQDVRRIVRECDSLEVIIRDDRIIVRTLKKAQILKWLPLEQVLGYKRTGEIIIDRAGLAMAAGAEQICFDFSSYLNHSEEEILRTELNEVARVISLFSGAGMLDLPFKRDRAFEIVFGIDRDRNACKSYRENIGSHIVCGDIRDNWNIPPGNVVIGGPSCCPFSGENGKNQGSGHPDKNLVDSYLRIVKEKNPEIFVIENVPGFVSKENGKWLEKVMCLSEKDYIKSRPYTTYGRLSSNITLYIVFCCGILMLHVVCCRLLVA